MSFLKEARQLDRMIALALLLIGLCMVLGFILMFAALKMLVWIVSCI